MKHDLFFKKSYIIFLIFLVLGFLLYGVAIKGPWVFDDYTTVVDNSTVQDLNLSFKNIFYRFRGFSNFTFALNYALFKDKPVSYHIFNILIHITSSFLVYLLLKEVLSFKKEKTKLKDKALKERNLIALIAGLFFLIHPVQTQAVSYITQRFEGLTALFYILSLYLYTKARKEKRFYLYVITFIVAHLTTFCKETGLTIPIALVLYELFFITRGQELLESKKFLFNTINLKKLFKNLFTNYFLIIIVVSILIRVLFVQGVVGGFSQAKLLVSTEWIDKVTSEVTKGKVINRTNYLLTQINVIVRYISLVFVPVSLRVDYDYPIASSLFSFPTFFSFLIIVFLLVVALLFFKKYRLASFGILFFFLGLMPSSSIFPVDDLIFEHRLYLSMLGICFVLVEVLLKLEISKIYPLIILWFIGLSGLSLQRNYLWSDKFKLWQDNYKKAPQKARVIKNYGVELFFKGRNQEAVGLLKTAVAKEPDSVPYNLALAVVLEKSGQLEEAEEQYLKAVEIDDQEAGIYFLVGYVQVQQEKFKESIENFESAVSLDQDYALGYAGHCAALYGLKEMDKAIEYCNQALEINPNSGLAHHTLYLIYTYKDDFKKAADHLDRAKRAEKTLKRVI